MTSEVAMDPSGAVRTLSTTEWGALFIIMAFVCVTTIVLLLKAIRAMHQENQNLAGMRVQDLQEVHSQSQEMAQKSLDALNEASVVIRDLNNKVCKLEDAITGENGLKSKVDCRLCPAKAQAGGTP